MSTIEVEGPDGSVVEFPADTPQDEIRFAMASRFGFGRGTGELDRGASVPQWYADMQRQRAARERADMRRRTPQADAFVEEGMPAIMPPVPRGQERIGQPAPDIAETPYTAPRRPAYRQERPSYARDAATFEAPQPLPVQPPPDPRVGQDQPSEVGKGWRTGIAGGKQMAAAGATIPLLGAAKTLADEISIYLQIDAGAAPRATGTSYLDDRARLYMGASPAAREKLKEIAKQRLGSNADARAALVDAWKRYEADVHANQGRTANFTDIRDIDGFGNWLSFNLGQALPYLGATATATILGGALGGAPGAMAGLVGSGYAMGVGDVQSEMIKKGRGEDLGAAATSLVAGVPYAALDLLGPVGRSFRAIGKPALETVARSYFQRLGREVPANLVEEFINEAGQEIVKDFAVSTQTGEKVVTPENLVNWFNAGMAGAAAGGASAPAVAALGGRGTAQKPGQQPGQAGQIVAGAAQMPPSQGGPRVEPTFGASVPTPVAPGVDTASPGETAPAPRPEPTRDELEAVLASDRPVDEIVRQNRERAAAQRQADADAAQRASVVSAVEAEQGAPAAAAVSRALDGEGTRAKPLAATTREDVDAAAVQAATPTPAQAAAGTYRKGHVRLQGLDIAIEVPRGGTRSGVDASGKPWSVDMPAHYGYLKAGKDSGDGKVDVFIGDNPESTFVLIIDQIDPATGKFDEPKVMVGYPNRTSALIDYEDSYSDGSGSARVGAYHETTIEGLKAWLQVGNPRKPVGYRQPQTQAPAAAAPAEPSPASERAAPARPGSAPSPAAPVAGPVASSYMPTASWVKSIADRIGVRNITPQEIDAALALIADGHDTESAIEIAIERSVLSEVDDGTAQVEAASGPADERAREDRPGEARDEPREESRPATGKKGATAARRDQPAGAQPKAGRAVEPSPAAPKAAVPKAPPSIVQWAARNGGIKDNGSGATDKGGDLRYVMGRAQMLVPRYGVLRNDKRGMDPDLARELAVEAGYLPEGASISDLYDAIARTLKGDPVYSTKDVDEALDDADARKRQRDAERAEFEGRAGEGVGEPAVRSGYYGARRRPIGTRSVAGELDFPDLSGPFAQRVARIETWLLARGRRTGHEALVTLDSITGELIAADTADVHNAVPFTDKAWAAAERPDRQIVGFHNHPSSRSLSPQDLVTTAMPGMRAVIAYGHDGKSAYMGAVTDDFRRLLAEHRDRSAESLIKLAIASFESRLEAHVWQAMHFGLVKIDDANYLHGHVVNLVLARAGVTWYTSTVPASAISALRVTEAMIDNYAAAVSSRLTAGIIERNPYASEVHDRLSVTLRIPGRLAEFLGHGPTAGPAITGGPARTDSGAGGAPEGFALRPERGGEQRGLDLPTPVAPPERRADPISRADSPAAGPRFDPGQKQGRLLEGRPAIDRADVAADSISNEQFVIPGAERVAAAGKKRARAAQQSVATTPLFGGALTGETASQRDDSQLAFFEGAPVYGDPARRDALLRSGIAGLRDALKSKTDLGVIRNLLNTPRHIAANFRGFAPIYTAIMDQFAKRDRMIAELAALKKPYETLTAAQKANVNKLLELGRHAGTNYTPAADGTIRVLNEVGGFTPGGLAVREHGTVLSGDREWITLDKDEAAGYLAVRSTMNRGLDFYRDQLLREFDLDPADPATPKTSDEAQAQADVEPDPDRQKTLAAVAAKLAEIEKARRQGYIPFSRFGSHVITVHDVEGRVVYREHLERTGAREIESRLNPMRTFERRVAEIIKRLEKHFPKAKGYRIEDPRQIIPATADEIPSMATIDDLLAAAQLPEAIAEKVQEKIHEAIKRAGFRRHFVQAREIPGYSTDFERVISDYVVSLAGYLARREMRPVIEEATARIPTTQPRLRRYATDYVSYAQSPQEEFAPLRQAGFFMYLGGRISSAVVNLTQVQMITAPYLAQFANPARVEAQLARAYGSVSAAIRPYSQSWGGAGMGVIDPAKLPADVRDAVTRAIEGGTLQPIEMMNEFAISRGKTAGQRKAANVVQNVQDGAALVFTAAERINRMVTFIAAYRLAQDAKTLERADATLGENDLWSTDKRNRTPEGFAKWATDETQFVMGKGNRARFMRGVGAPVFQFKGFTLNSLELMARIAGMHRGAPSKAVLAVMWAQLAVVGGLFGMPGFEDLKALLEQAYKSATGVELDLDRELRQMIGGDAGRWAARGPLRDALGVDIGRRISLGNVIPGASSPTEPRGWLEAVGPLLGIPYDLAKRPFDVAQSLERGNIGGAVTRALPEAAADIVKAHQYTTDRGIVARSTGRKLAGPQTVLPDGSKLSDPSNVAKRALGFQPTGVARQMERYGAGVRVAAGPKDLQAQITTRLAIAMVAASRAKDRGDTKAEAEANASIQGIVREIEKHNATARTENRVSLFTPNGKPGPGLRQALMREGFGAVDIQERRAPRRARGALDDIRALY